MVLELIVVTTAATAAYLWLTAVVAPLWNGAAMTARALRGNGWWLALPLACSGALLMTAAVVTAVFLIAMNAPSAATWVMEGPELRAGVMLGVTLWMIRAVLAGLPRFSQRIEAEMALAVVLLAAANTTTVKKIEQRYAAHLAPAPSSPRYTNVPRGGRVPATSSPALR